MLTIHAKRNCNSRKTFERYTWKGKKAPKRRRWGKKCHERRAASQEWEAGSRKLQAGSEGQRARSGKSEGGSEKAEAQSQLRKRTTNNKLLFWLWVPVELFHQHIKPFKRSNPFEHTPRAGRSKIRQSGYGNPLKKRQGYFWLDSFVYFSHQGEK
jgi:hypothetical protein